jgi:succinyl-CoA synthetase beta subunit
VLVAPAASIEEEYYFSFLLDRANRRYLCIASVEGGVEIEEVAKTNPDAVRKIAINPGSGVDEEKAREIVAACVLVGPSRTGTIASVVVKRCVPGLGVTVSPLATPAKVTSSRAASRLRMPAV